jgi:hypothetical protein
MRKLTWIIFISGAILTIEPTHAQTYDPRYPVCMQLARDGSINWSCEYTSVAQCATSAIGRAGSCVMNPNFVQGSRRGIPTAAALRGHD